jgi:RNA polymerase sigma-70 factor (ECF subfamily)
MNAEALLEPNVLADTDPAFADDAALLARVRARDEAAFESLVRHYGGRMLATARRFLRCEQDCADAVQEAFLSALAHVDSFSGQARLGTWLQRIVINACLMKLRARRRRPSVSMEELLPEFDETGHHAAPIGRWSDSGLDRLAAEETRAEVRRCIDLLPGSYRTVLLLRDIEELDTEATATLLGTTPGNVKTRLHRARQALRTLLAPTFEGRGLAEAESSRRRIPS